MYKIADSSNLPGSNCTNGADTTYTSLCKNTGTSDFGGTVNTNCHYSWYKTIFAFLYYLK